MKFTTQLVFLLAATFALGLVIGIIGFKSMNTTENFDNQAYCYKCNQNTPCNCGDEYQDSPSNGSDRSDGEADADGGPNQNTSFVGKQTQMQQPNAPIQIIAPPAAQQNCPQFPDMSKYILKATVPSCPPLPDLSKYMLKTECPPYPDMSKYVLKSSVPSCPPCIASCNKPCKIGECPPCPRPRCPVVKCPEPKACTPCPTVSPERCPEPNVQCKSNYADVNPPRPMLASTSSWGF